ncbi:conserved hypothetical protein [Pediculus humanus corporis]|uniref:Small integral membrane protein 8 n=1 Tax=Pediculus humanus subsp. corporis TaxID=121224 RepID=E0VJ51_PEDHC|nr:uncharacterized protein Phum_PHUM238620 [Pediculus humanus corporis]EEB13407.1 conserved hypothetical protein [Pediculus humanus corporis]
MNKNNSSKPGEGIKSLKTSSLFRALNFELYVAPNKFIMGLGASAFGICVGYIMYMRYKYEGLGYYPGVNADGTENYYKRKSNWD